MLKVVGTKEVEFHSHKAEDIGHRLLTWQKVSLSGCLERMELSPAPSLKLSDLGLEYHL